MEERFVSLGFACADTSRESRCGRPEAIYCPGKTPDQVAEIAATLHEKNGYVLATRAEESHFKAVRKLLPDAVHHPEARIISIGTAKTLVAGWKVGVAAGGTADRNIQEEAAVTLEVFGWEVSRVPDIGVAGLHRLLDRIELLRSCKVLIVIAGMEGALPSVVTGLVRRPVIAVPTSAGYGAHFGGLAPLLSMLNSCASGMTVVNIDNGFGAACAADSILRLAAETGS